MRRESRRLLRHLKRALRRGAQHRSKLSSEVAALDGMSGQSTRHFLNRLCAREGLRYLEIGTWKGSTLCAAAFQNRIDAVAIDDWSGFGGPREECLENIRRYTSGSRVQLIEEDCFDVDRTRLGKFDVYFYDGAHEEEDHYRAIVDFYDNLADLAVVLVDDWNWEPVRKGTFRALDTLRVPVVFERKIRLTRDNSHTPESRAAATWHNGLYVFVLDKTRRYSRLPLIGAGRSR